MTGKVYCYHCMTYHHPDAMRKVVTRAGERWRCIRWLVARPAQPLPLPHLQLRQFQPGFYRYTTVEIKTASSPRRIYIYRYINNSS